MLSHTNSRGEVELVEVAGLWTEKLEKSGKIVYFEYEWRIPHVEWVRWGEKDYRQRLAMLKEHVTKLWSDSLVPKVFED
jgi:hypothetical protein